jgi:hypothetical protein
LWRLSCGKGRPAEPAKTETIGVFLAAIGADLHGLSVLRR